MVSASRSWNIPKDQTISYRLHLGDPLLLSKKKRLDMSLILKYLLFIFLLVIKGFIGAPVFKKKYVLRYSYDVVLVSIVQQSESAIHACRSSLFWILFPLRSPQSLARVSRAIQKVLISYLFIHSNVYMSVPTSLFIPPKILFLIRSSLSFFFFLSFMKTRVSDIR